ncbi:MAG: methyl-accepting chemotaxis protein [Treponema sp.]|nr:methyl-accepting chemotaxis protein [Treponema sp.]MCL2236712.1 methyl-accepting chemotaxis protein [Treponema sp.]
MTENEIRQLIKIDEFNGEKIICKIRMVLAIIFLASVPLISFSRVMNGESHFPPQAYFCCCLFFVYSIFIHFYLSKKTYVHSSFKYICVIIDMTIHSASIWIGCTYPLIAPAISYLSTWALFFLVLIMVGAFRYSVRCAYFSGVFAGLCYLSVVIINEKHLDLPYFFILENETMNVRFPVFNETFRVMAMVVTGAITGFACKRHFSLFNNMINTQISATEAASRTVEQTRNMAKTIQKSTDEIFLSSKEIFSTANSQAASIQEIEATIGENTGIAGDIAEKTSSVASIVSKMENDVIHGFTVLGRNVDQLEDIKMKNDGLISGIVSLGNKISKIRDIVKNINTITDQTKVIAFNAALEAASAGDKGKRFSVVASEVNRLADDISSLTKQIRENVEEIQGSSSSLIVASEESAEKITEGNNLIRELEEIFTEIRSGAEITANRAQTITISTQKQQKSSEQINIAIADISKGLTNFIQSTRIATGSAQDLVQLTGELGELLTDKDETKNEGGV